MRRGEVFTPAALTHAEAEEKHREAELRRLLYVACTRAERKLVLVSGPPSRKVGSWLDLLSPWGYTRADGRAPPEGTLHGGTVLHVECPAAEDGGPARDPAGAADDGDLLRAAERFAHSVAELDPDPPGALLAPSARVEDGSGEGPEEGSEEGPGERLGPAATPGTAATPGPAGTPGPAAAEGPAATLDPAITEDPGAERDLALALGSAVHLLLSLWDRRDEAWLDANAPRAAAVAAAERGLEPAAIAERLEARIRAWRASGRLRALASETALAREMPILLLDEHGRTWDGTVDLVEGSPEHPVVVDYKTDASGDPEDLREVYAGQLGIYAQAVRIALGLASPPPVEIRVV